MTTLAVKINPNVLIWAREQQGVSIDWAIHKSGFPRLPQWERGSALPTMRQLRDLAHLYRRPSAIFFLSRLPEQNRAATDFRRHAGTEADTLSSEARTEIRVCESRRTRALDLGSLLGNEMRLSLDTLSLDDNVELAADHICGQLGIELDILAKLKTDKAALDYWISRIEASNCLVFRSITLSSFNASFKEIRGTCAFYDEYPWILLNSQEHERAQLFTLLHELTHLLLHDPGICTLAEQETITGTERFCNSASAAILMPKALVESLVHARFPDLGGEGIVEQAVDFLASHFHVSKEAAARRLVSLGLATWSYYSDVRARQIVSREQERQALKEGEGGGNGKYYFKRVLAWNGIAYCSIVLNAYHRDSISLGEAAEALRTKTNHVESIERELFG